MKAKLKKITDFQLIFEPTKPPSLKIGNWYTIKPYKKDRTLDQNAYLWAILGEIQKETGTNKWDLYIGLLEANEILVNWLETIPEAEETLKRIYRIVELKENRINSKGIRTCLFKCYVGSSTFNTNEMKILIDEAISLAESLGISVETLESEEQ